MCVSPKKGFKVFTRSLVVCEIMYSITRVRRKINNADGEWEHLFGKAGAKP